MGGLLGGRVGALRAAAGKNSDPYCWYRDGPGDNSLIHVPSLSPYLQNHAFPWAYTNASLI